ncbi:MAG TPA: SH3 domain-containing protein [Alphaproteobacteria bacterium]|nr:SH3 domain-containing protein [Alphaproteobacteria bacterium]
MNFRNSLTRLSLVTRHLSLAVWIGLALVNPLHAAEAPAPGPTMGIASAIKRSGLPLPRWASLRGEEVNLRAGPGFRYPVSWVYRRKGLPVEIVAEFDVWRRIRDMAGDEGWVHQANLSGKRSFIVTGGKTQPVFRDHTDKASLRAELEAGVQGRLLRCRDEWCKVEVEGLRGYMKKSAVWGVYSQEKVD